MSRFRRSRLLTSSSRTTRISTAMPSTPPKPPACLSWRFSCSFSPSFVTGATSRGARAELPRAARSPNVLKVERLSKLDREPLVVVVLGPTASGKTALALAIARRFGGEIVNCDSVAMYREFEIGTAKPSPAERVEIPHHLLDCIDPLADINAGEYARQARRILREIVLRKNLPMVSGGTGLYLRALLDGLFSGPQRSDELRAKLRGRAQKRGPEHLHRILRRLDSAAASRIHANDIPKVIRAIEVCLASRQTMTKLWQQGGEPLQGFRILRLGPTPAREALYARINQRAAKMFD